MNLITQNNIETDFVQIRLWCDCVNNCTFCSLQNENRHTTLADKKKRLENATQFVSGVRASRIGLIGGEFFEGQLKGCENEWCSLLRALKNTEANILITANLIHKQYMLEETIDKLDKKLLLCTSYDEVGRFHTVNHKKKWFSRIEHLHKMNVDLFCTCIPTQDFFQSSTTFPAWLNINLCDPHLGCDWYRLVDKENYHQLLIKQNKLFNLPKRKTAVSWLKNHPDTCKRYADYSTSHSGTIYGFNNLNEIIIEDEGRLTKDKYINPKCNHPYFCQCYADSEKCMMCDATQIANSF